MKEPCKKNCASLPVSAPQESTALPKIRRCEIHRCDFLFSLLPPCLRVEPDHIRKWRARPSAREGCTPQEGGKMPHSRVAGSEIVEHFIAFTGVIG